MQSSVKHHRSHEDTNEIYTALRVNLQEKKMNKLLRLSFYLVVKKISAFLAINHTSKHKVDRHMMLNCFINHLQLHHSYATRVLELDLYLIHRS